MNKRNVGLDLLRILAMFMIVILHYLSKGGALDVKDITMHNFVWIIEAFAIGAVNMYVLISGYFLVDSKFKWKKVFLLWGQVLFYSFTFLTIYLLCGNSIGKLDLISNVFPVLMKNSYWFITVYLLLYICSPFLNILIERLSKKQHFQVCLFLIIFFCIIQTLLPYESLIDNSCGVGLIWFIVLYFIAGYLKKYDFKIKGKKLLLGYVISSFMIFGLTFGIEFVLNQFSISFKVDRFYSYNNIFPFLSAFFLFLYFKDLKIKKQSIIKSIQFFAPLTFGVYLIHENFVIRKIIYYGMARSENYVSYGIFYFLFILIISVLIIFLTCSVIEYIRKKIAKYLSKTKAIQKTTQKLEQFGNRFQLIIEKAMNLLS